MPGLKTDGLKSAFVYSDAGTNDTKLVATIIRTAVEQGALVANYTEATGFVQEHGRIVGVEARDTITGETYTIAARHVVNATGVWAEKVESLGTRRPAGAGAPREGDSSRRGRREGRRDARCRRAAGDGGRAADLHRAVAGARRDRHDGHARRRHRAPARRRRRDRLRPPHDERLDPRATDRGGHHQHLRRATARSSARGTARSPPRWRAPTRCSPRRTASSRLSAAN